ncbi:MAG TPA: SAM-dependent methyltransferase [Lachnospiraceae bacterium]|nr:SAM-dependent methyltransferase [Lachnospiraceae bacterium]
MLNNKGFDLWANHYDQSVHMSEEANEYPFAGYKNVLNKIYNIVRQGKGKNVLELGFGTGILAQKLYEDGYTIYGIDFSEKMIEIAKKKMPDATLIQYDFSHGIPKELKNLTFDAIICTYAIHHLNNKQKIEFLKQLQTMLSPNGKILIGDVAFLTVEEMEACKKEQADKWDDEEIYPVMEEMKGALPSIKFDKISHCAGIFVLEKDKRI